MNLPAIETLLSQEMNEVKGGGGNIGATCTCKSGAAQGPGTAGHCECENGAAQSTSPETDPTNPDKPIYICQTAAFKVG